MLFSLSPSVLPPVWSPREPRGFPGVRKAGATVVSKKGRGIVVRCHLFLLCQQRRRCCTRAGAFTHTGGRSLWSHPHAEICFSTVQTPYCPTTVTQWRPTAKSPHRSGLSPEQWGSFCSEEELPLGERVNCRSGFKLRVEIVFQDEKLAFKWQWKIKLLGAVGVFH